MAFTGKLGTTDSRPGDIILGGDSPAGGGPQIYDRALESILSMTVTVTSNIQNEEPTSVLELTQEATCPQIRRPVATSSLSFTITVSTNIFMETASSPISLTSTTRAGTLEVSATSSLALTQTAGSNIRNVSASSPIVASVAAVGESTRSPTSSALSLTQTATLSGVPRRKSATSAITVTQTAIGIGPYKPVATSALSITDMARQNIIQLPVFDVLILSDAARVANTYEISATSALVLNQSAIGVNNHVYATSAIALADEADTTEKRRSVTDAITVTDTATVEKVKVVKSTLTLTDSAVQGIVGVSLTSALSLTDLARIVSIKIVASPSVIELTDTVTSNIKMLSAESTLVLADSLNVIRPWRVSAVNELTTIELVFDLDTFTFIEVITGLQDSVSVLQDSPRLTSNIISFATQATQYILRADAIAAAAESVLALTDQGRISKSVSNESQTINLTQSATGVVGTELTSDLDTLDVAATVTISRANITASNTLEVVQSVAFIIEKSNVLCTYTPFVGATSDPDAPTPPPTTYTAAGVTPGFRLQYPGIGGVTDELILRAPNLGNLDRLSMTRINRETRGGTLIVYADPVWPKVQTLLLSFSGLSYTESQALLAFMEGHIGEEIRLIDWEDRLWRGVIVNPQDPVVQDGKGCKYTASFEFEGEKV
jgi:hypothetical protein